MSEKVLVRIALATDKNGAWNAIGWSGGGSPWAELVDSIQDLESDSPPSPPETPEWIYAAAGEIYALRVVNDAKDIAETILVHWRDSLKD